MIQGVIEETGFNAEYLELEITETAMMSDTQRSDGVLKALAAMGISVAIDDFGTGYCSLSYLRTLSVQTLKIDRSFVKQVASSAKD